LTLYPFSFTTKKQNAESTIDVFTFIRDYLVDQEEGIHQLINWFSNLLIEEEVLLQSGTAANVSPFAPLPSFTSK